MSTKNQLKQATEVAISDGRKILAELSDSNGKQQGAVDQEAVSKWLCDCRNLMRLIGDKAASYADAFKDNSLFLSVFRCKSMLGALESLLGTMDQGLLVSIENLVFAEGSTNVLEQAEDLLDNGHCLAAGVICRALFEEHLRKLYGVNHPLGSGKPTIQVMVRSLTESEVFTKIAAMNVDAILRQGNHCAYNKQPPLKESDIRGMIQKVRNFLIQHPLQ